MKIIRRISIVTVTSLVLLVSTTAAAQSTIDSPLAQAVIRVSNAVGVVLDATADYQQYLSALVAQDLTIPNTQLVVDTEFVSPPTGEFSPGGFCIFLADVLAGLEPDPGFLVITPAEQELTSPVDDRVATDESYLQTEFGVTSCDALLDLDELGNFLSDVDFGADSTQDTSTSVISPRR